MKAHCGRAATKHIENFVPLKKVGPSVAQPHICRLQLPNDIDPLWTRRRGISVLYSLLTLRVSHPFHNLSLKNVQDRRHLPSTSTSNNRTQLNISLPISAGTGHPIPASKAASDHQIPQNLLSMDLSKGECGPNHIPNHSGQRETGRSQGVSRFVDSACHGKTKAKVT